MNVFQIMGDKDVKTIPIFFFGVKIPCRVFVFIAGGLVFNCNDPVRLVILFISIYLIKNHSP